jgi:hypothetical protein
MLLFLVILVIPLILVAVGIAIDDKGFKDGVEVGERLGWDSGYTSGVNQERRLQNLSRIREYNRGVEDGFRRYYAGYQKGVDGEVCIDTRNGFVCPRRYYR